LPVLGMLILYGLLSHQIVGKVCTCYLSLCSIFIIIIIITTWKARSVRRRSVREEKKEEGKEKEKMKVGE
jgi:Na+/melibiose symporter-like transporter